MNDKAVGREVVCLSPWAELSNVSGNSHCVSSLAIIVSLQTVGSAGKEDDWIVVGHHWRSGQRLPGPGKPRKRLRAGRMS